MKFWICNTCHGNYSEKWIGENIASTTGKMDFCGKCGIPATEISDSFGTIDVEVSIVGETFRYTYWQILGLITRWIQDPPKEI